MDVVFYDSPGKRAVTTLVEAALAKGLREHGDGMTPYRGQESVERADVVAIMGISNEARDVVKQCRKMGKSFFILDKGYVRRKSRGDLEHNAYWRVGINALHALFSFDRSLPPERWQKLNMRLGKIREPGDGAYVLVLGTAIRVFIFSGLGGAEELEKYFNNIIRQILAVTSLPVRLRSKIASVPLSGGRFSRQKSERVAFCPAGNTIAEDLSGAAVAVTHTTNAGVAAVIAGVPVVELGTGVVRPLAETSLDKVINPKRYTEKEREEFLHWLAWQQWTLAEMRSGEMWRRVRRWLTS